MERIHTLINKLQDQLNKNQNPQNLLSTAQLLVAELSGIEMPDQIGKVSVWMPSVYFSGVDNSNNKETIVTTMVKREEPFVIAKNIGVQKPVYNNQIKKEVFEINDVIAKTNNSLNDTIKVEKKELVAKLADTKIKDLNKVIGINEKYLYINELFQGDETMYERSVKTINNFSVFPEADQWIRRELYTKLCWINENPTVKQFDQLVKRRFA